MRGGGAEFADLCVLVCVHAVALALILACGPLDQGVGVCVPLPRLYGAAGIAVCRVVMIRVVWAVLQSVVSGFRAGVPGA